MNRRSFLLASAAFRMPLLALDEHPGRLSLDPVRKLGPIASDFIGLGYEISSVAAGVLSPDRRDYVRLVQKLGSSGVIRIGGNTSDDAFFRAQARSVSAPKGTIVNGDNLRQLGSFLAATGWKLIWGLNLGSGTVAQAVEEAKAVSAAVKGNLLAFEIGNEPDLFGHGTSHRPSNYSYEDYLREYRIYKTAIRRELPSAPFAGPDAATATDWVTRFAADEGRDLVLLTHHYYRECAKATSTIEKLLSPDPKLAPQLEKLSAASRAAGVPYRICEVNSFCGGGKPGVSDTLASALWVLDYMFTLAWAGAAGVNIETGVNQLGWMSWYSPLITDDRGNVFTRPEFSGMSAFMYSSGGERLWSECEAGELNFKAYPVATRSGQLAITLINKDLKRNAAISVVSKKRLNALSLHRLSGPSLASKEGVVLRADKNPPTFERLLIPAGSAAILTCSYA